MKNFFHQNFSLIWGIALMLLMVQACEQPVNNLPPVATFNLTNGTEISIDQELTISAENSIDPEGEMLSFTWEITNSPSGSNYQLNAMNEQATFQSDKAGTYEVTLTVSDVEDLSDAVSATIVVTSEDTNQEPYVIEDHIESDMVIENLFDDPEKVDCIVKRNFDVSALLTIEPGVVMAFEQEAGLKVKPNGAIIAIGTSEDSIKFTGTQKINGYWKSLHFDESNDTRNELTYCTVEYGGMEAYGLDAMIIVGAKSTSRVKIKNSIIQYSAQAGISVREDGVLSEFQNNEVAHNDKYPVFIHPDAQPNLDATSTYINNEDDHIFVQDNENYETVRDMTWEKLDVPYSVQGLRLGENLTIQPGVVIEMRQEGQIVVNEGGSLTAVGTSDEKIFINAGSQTVSGYWDQIRFRSNDVNNKLEYCNIAYGGKDGDYDEEGMIQIEGNARASINNCDIHHSQLSAIYLERHGILASFESNNVTANDLYPVTVDAESDFSLSGTSTYSGNGKDEVYVRNGELSKDQSWEELDVPYSVGDLLVGKHLTLEAGVDIEVRHQGYITVKAGVNNLTGVLTAVGTEVDSVTIRGAQHTKGYWQNLYFNGSNDTANELKFCHVADAGIETSSSNRGVIRIQGNGFASVSNSKIGNTNVYPIMVDGEYGSTIDVESNTYYNYSTPDPVAYTR